MAGTRARYLNTAGGSLSRRPPMLLKIGAIGLWYQSFRKKESVVWARHISTCSNQFSLILSWEKLILSRNVRLEHPEPPSRPPNPRGVPLLWPGRAGNSFHAIIHTITSIFLYNFALSAPKLLILSPISAARPPRASPAPA